MKRCIFLVLLLFPVIAWANPPCIGPSVSDGWGASFYGTHTVTGFVYSTSTKLLYSTFPTIQYAVSVNVPNSTASAFANTRNPDSFYSASIYPPFHEAMQAENCNIMLTENGSVILAR